jgi:hypothetical protein
MKKYAGPIVSLTVFCLSVSTAFAQQAPVNLRSDSGFALLAGTTVTVTGGGTITSRILSATIRPVSLAGLRCIRAGALPIESVELSRTGLYGD